MQLVVYIIIIIHDGILWKSIEENFKAIQNTKMQ